MLDCLFGKLIPSSGFSVKPLKTCTLNLGNCSVSSQAILYWSITASDSTTFHYMQGIDTFIKNCFDSIALSVFEKHIFTFCHPNLHCNYHAQQVHGRNILRCAFSLILCFKVFLWRMIIPVYSKLLALTEHWSILYLKNLSLISNICKIVATSPSTEVSINWKLAKVK